MDRTIRAGVGFAALMAVMLIAACGMTGQVREAPPSRKSPATTGPRTTQPAVAAEEAKPSPQQVQEQRLAALAQEIATKISALTSKGATAKIWPLKVTEPGLRSVAAIFEDLLLPRLVEVDTSPRITWTPRRGVERALQEMVNMRRPDYDVDEGPRAGRFAAVSYTLIGRLLVDADAAAGSVRLVLDGTIDDIESTLATASISADITFTGLWAKEMLRSIGQRSRPFGPLDDVDRFVWAGKVGEKVAEADRAYDFRRHEDALRLYREAEDMATQLGLKKEHAPIFYRLGNLYAFEEKTPDTALKYYARAIELDESYYLALNNAGHIWFERQDYAKADEYFNRVLKIEPDFAIGHYNRGLAVLESGTVEPRALRRALEDLTAAAAAGPSGFTVGHQVEGNKKVVQAHYYRGVLQERLGNDGEAWDSFTKALGSDPDHAAAHYELMALAYRKEPRDRAAVAEHAQAYLKLEPRGERRTTAERALRMCQEESELNELAEETAPELKKLSGLLRFAESNYGSIYTQRLKKLYVLWLSRSRSRKLGDGTMHKVEMSVVKATGRAGQPVAVAEGDELRSGADYYRVVYVWQVDSTGKVCPIFPYTHPDLPMGEIPPNPIPPGSGVRCPGQQWFLLDENVGTENVMFLVSEDQREDIEELLLYFNERVWDGRSAQGMFVEGLEEKPTGITRDESGGLVVVVGDTISGELRKDTTIRTRGIKSQARGIGGVTQLTLPGGGIGEFRPVVFEAAESELAGRFWFRHVAR